MFRRTVLPLVLLSLMLLGEAGAQDEIVGTPWTGDMGVQEMTADIMARQLIKRADQLVAERGQNRAEAMAYLLRLVVQGRQGEVPKDFPLPDRP